MKLLNLLIEKRVLFTGALLLLISVTLVSGEILFTSYDDKTDPWIDGFTISGFDVLRKEEIITGDVVWPNGNQVGVGIWTSANGLGIGEGTLQSVTIVGQHYSIRQDGYSEAGTKDLNGKQEYEDVIIESKIIRSISADSTAKSYPWSAEGIVKITPYVWQQSVTKEIAIHFPLQESVTYSTSGTWILEDIRSITRAAPSGNSGTHNVEHKYYCSVCDAEGETAEAIGGVEVHEVIKCERVDCGVYYRKCDTDAAALHSICEGCSKWRCDTSHGKDH